MVKLVRTVYRLYFPWFLCRFNTEHYCMVDGKVYTGI